MHCLLKRWCKKKKTTLFLLQDSIKKWWTIEINNSSKGSRYDGRLPSWKGRSGSHCGGFKGSGRNNKGQISCFLHYGSQPHHLLWQSFQGRPLFQRPALTSPEQRRFLHRLQNHWLRAGCISWAFIQLMLVRSPPWRRHHLPTELPLSLSKWERADALMSEDGAPSIWWW